MCDLLKEHMHAILGWKALLDAGMNDFPRTRSRVPARNVQKSHCALQSIHIFRELASYMFIMASLYLLSEDIT
jgi:hypothetical protein